MITFDQRASLHELTGLPREFFGTLYRTLGANKRGEGAIYYWRLGETGAGVMFAPAEVHLASPKHFARKLRLAQPPDADKWKPLIKAVMDAAVII